MPASVHQRQGRNQGKRAGFGPFAPGFKTIEYGDAAALSAAITPNTAAFLVEPIQGERGIVVPPQGYLQAIEKICRKNNVLLILDEIQTGLGRTGRFLAYEHENVKPDGLILGKALGGGLLPVSLFLSRRDIMHVFTPGDHGSTFGGNPLATSAGVAVIETLLAEGLIAKAKTLGDKLLADFKTKLAGNPKVVEIRGKGLMIGIELNAPAAELMDKARAKGILINVTSVNTIRLLPTFILTDAEADELVTKVVELVTEF